MNDALIIAIAKCLDCEPKSLSEDSGLGKHPRWDSLGHITVMTMLERDHAMEITEENVAILVTVADIRDHLSALGAERR